MANQERGEYDFQHKGKTYTLRFDYNRLAEAETLLDMGIAEITMMLANTTQTRIGVWRAMMFVGLKQSHPEMTLERAGILLGDIGLTKAIEYIGKAMQLAFPEAKPAEAASEENPPLASPSTGENA